MKSNQTSGSAVILDAGSTQVFREEVCGVRYHFPHLYILVNSGLYHAFTVSKTLQNWINPELTAPSPPPPPHLIMGFPHSSVGKESACSAGDPSLIPGSGRAPGEGVGYPLQYSWALLVAQLVKNPPAMRGYLGSIPGLGSKSLEKGTATCSSILAWRIPWSV